MKLDKKTIKVLFAMLLPGFLSACIGPSARTAQPDDFEPDRSASAAQLAAVRGATAGRLLKAALNVDDQLDLCAGLVSHNDPVKILRVKKPPFMKFYREPAFNTRVIRITNSAPNEVHKPIFSTMQAWNADESLLLLYRTGNRNTGYVLLDGDNYQFEKSLNITAVAAEQLFWSHNDPSILYYVSADFRNGGWLMRYDVRNETEKRIRRFDGICPANDPNAGNGIQMQSLDDDLFGFRCPVGAGHIMFSYRISTDQIHTVQTGEGTNWGPLHAPMPAPSGRIMEVQGRVISPELDTIFHKLDQSVFYEHASLGRTSEGQDALFQTIFDPSPKGCDGGATQGVGHLTEFNLVTGRCRSIINESSGWPYTTSGTHVSAVSRHRPGWVAMSSIGYGNFENFDAKTIVPPLFSEIYLVNTDPDNTKLCRLAQHRSFAKEAKNGQYDPVYGEPHVTISPSGTRLIFGSDWYDSGSVDSYVIELPAHKR